MIVPCPPTCNKMSNPDDDDGGIESLNGLLNAEDKTKIVEELQTKHATDPSVLHHVIAKAWFEQFRLHASELNANLSVS